MNNSHKHPRISPLLSSLMQVAADPNDKRKHEDRVFNFDLSPQDAELVLRIVGRAVSDAGELRIPIDKRLSAMDLTVVHNHIGGLHLLRLLMSERADFANDFVGIAVNLDRRAGKLLNDFVPIFTKGEPHK